MRTIQAFAAALMAIALTAVPAEARTGQCKGGYKVTTYYGPVIYKSFKYKTFENRSFKMTASKKTKKNHSYSNTYTSGSSRGSLSGMASFYWQGHTTANGESYKPEGMTAAHKTLPFGTRVRVTNRNNGQSVVVRINDRGPFIAGRIIDLSRGAARVVGMQNTGVAPVSVQILGRG